MGSESRKINLQYDRQAELNREQNAWQSGENAIDRAWQEKQWLSQFNMQNEEYNKRLKEQREYDSYQSEVARMLAAGINPAAVFSQGAGGIMHPASTPQQPSSPSGLGSHSVSPLGVSPVGFSTDAAMFSSLAQLNDALAKAAQTGLNVERQKTMIGAELQNVVADTDSKRLQNVHQDLVNNVYRAFGDKQASASFMKTLGEYFKAVQDGNESGASAALKKAEEQLTNTKNKQEEGLTPIIIDNAKEEGNLLRAKQKTESARQVESYASAEEHKAGAREKDASANSIAYDNVVKAWRNQLMDNNEYRERWQMEMLTGLDAAVKEHKITDIEYQQAKYALDHMEIDYWFEKGERVAGIVSDFIGKASGAAIAKSFLDKNDPPRNYELERNLRKMERNRRKMDIGAQYRNW